MPHAGGPHAGGVRPMMSVSDVKATCDALEVSPSAKQGTGAIFGKPKTMPSGGKSGATGKESGFKKSKSGGKGKHRY